MLWHLPITRSMQCAHSVINANKQPKQQKGATGFFRRVLSCLGVLFGTGLALYLLDIGCVFRAITGVPCPGCGMTRAWLEALHLDFYAALAYHPLFWCVPIVFGVAVAQPNIRSERARGCIDIVAAVLLVVLAAVWIVRLVDPADAGLLFGGHAPMGVPADIIHIEAPRWLSIVKGLM